MATTEAWEGEDLNHTTAAERYNDGLHTPEAGSAWPACKPRGPHARGWQSLAPPLHFLTARLSDRLFGSAYASLIDRRWSWSIKLYRLPGIPVLTQNGYGDDEDEEEEDHRFVFPRCSKRLSKVSSASQCSRNAGLAASPDGYAFSRVAWSCAHL